MQSRIFDLEGPVHFADFGGEGRTMVLVHGLGGSHLDWTLVGPQLARSAHVLAIDLAGFGRSPLAGRSAGVRANQRLLDRFVAAVATKPAILVGSSMGGLIAIMEAAERPEQVAGLVLVAPGQPWQPGTRIDPLAAAAYAAYAVPLLGRLLLYLRGEFLGPEGAVRSALHLYCADPTRVPHQAVEAIVALERERRACMPWADAALAQASRSLVVALYRSPPFTALVQRVVAPTLLIQGTKDRLVPLGASLALAARRPDWSMAVIEGVGHMPHLEAADEFVSAVSGWIDGPGH
jgi:pimeloyl-ACP methyl ester carboxylesterase